ncbi:protein phosphatase regulator [Elasticomyces elasticus]|nr:protein phosphatase regulator [Elasticomyces elasticus]
MNANNDALIAQFCAITGASSASAEGALAAADWDLDQAVTLHYTMQDEPQDDSNMSDTEEPRPIPTTSSASSEPQSSSSTSRKPPPSSKLRTLRDLQSGRDDDEDQDDSDDTKQDFFAGGEKSGLAVQNPNKKPNDHFNNILKQAAENRSRAAGSDDEQPQQPSAFRGAGVTLGGDDTASQIIPDPNAARAQPSPHNAKPRVQRTLHLWRNGYSVDDGPLFRFDDPANAADLAMINTGHAPYSLLEVEPGQEVELEVHPHKDEDYVKPKTKYKPFSGGGQRLGAPTPGPSQPSVTTGFASSVTPPTSTPASSAPSVQIDESQPILTLQIRLGNGTRLQSRFNSTHTIGDVYEFVNTANAESRSRNWALMTTFPSKELGDKGVVLGDIAEFKRGGVVVQKWT